MDILTQILNLNSGQFQGFIFIVSRISGIFIDAPLLSNRNIPALVKIGLVVFLALLIFPFISFKELPSNLALWPFFLNIAKELWVGLVLGFCARLIFIGVQIAGQLMDYQIGFSFVNIVDPESRTQVPLMGQFLFILTMLVFMLINGHHWVIRSIVKSFEVIPLGAVKFDPALVTNINKVFLDVFIIAFKIASPVMMTLFLVDVACGIIARLVPQANILIVGFPLKIGLGLWLLLISLPLFFMVIKRIFTQILLNFGVLFRLM